MTLFAPPHLLDGARWRGMRVGLLGGSFNPPHAGHLHISNVALRRLGLDCVWWLVTPQNPLKTADSTPPLAQRMAWCRALTRDHPRLIVSDIETQMGTQRTVHTLVALKKRFPATDFTFLIGSDLVAQFPRWARWREIPRDHAIAIIARPPALELARRSALCALQNKKACARLLTGPMNPLSSTAIRANLHDPANPRTMKV